jgi:hypothetical protein
MIAAIYARKSTEQPNADPEAKSVARHIENARAFAAAKGGRSRRVRVAGAHGLCYFLSDVAHGCHPLPDRWGPVAQRRIESRRRMSVRLPAHHRHPSRARAAAAGFSRRNAR